MIALQRLLQVIQRTLTPTVAGSILDTYQTKARELNHDTPRRLAGRMRRIACAIAHEGIFTGLCPRRETQSYCTKTRETTPNTQKP